MAAVKLILAGEEVHLLGERAACWPAHKWLVVADLHWGKAETFQRFGLPVPSTVLTKDLTRLAKLCLETKPKKILVLGDLVHSRVGVTSAVVEEVAAFFALTGVEMILVRGNHDRAFQVPASWPIEVIDGWLDEGPFRFTHEGAEATDRFLWEGHLHPLVDFRGAGDRMRLPCFWLRQGSLVLPAFSAFTRGQNVNPSRGDQIFALAEGDLFEIPLSSGALGRAQPPC